MRETPWSRLIIFITCLMKVAEIQAQCERPNVGENMVMNIDLGQQTFLNGSTVKFQCSTGYRPVDSSVPRTITCVGTEWTNLELNCTKKTCGSLPDFPNGKYTYPNGILFGATAVAQCDEGYLLVGEKNRNCRDDGWDGRQPVCEVVKCSPPLAIQNGTFDPVDESYEYNQAVTYSCTVSYTLIGESVVTCSDDGTFRPSPPKCLLVECETPNIKNAVRVEGKSPPYGYKNVVRYECNEGHIMNGTGRLVCEENGWNPPPPECISQCERPNVGENMVMNIDLGQQTFLNGSTVKFQCSTGYRPVDSSVPRTITCVGTEWTNLELKCTKKTCGSLPDFPNGKYTYPNGILFGATAVAQCDEGYLLVGEKNRNCRDDGWDGRQPVCEVVKCSPPLAIQNGTFDPLATQCERPNVGENMVMNIDLGQQTFLNGSTVKFQCSTGYRPVDSSVPHTITCVGTEWTNLELKCTKKTCGSLPDFPNGKYTYPNGILFGATAVAQCAEGYLLVGEKNRNCRDDGWDGRQPVCEVVKCSPPLAIQNGTFDPVDESYEYNQAVTYSCTVSYTLIGESVVTCSDDGTFRPSPPKCLLVECDTPNIKNAVRVEGKSPPYGYKNVVRYECNEGHIMNGTGRLVCEENGWNPPPPECIFDRIQGPTTTSPPSDSNRVKPSMITIAAVVSIVVLLGPKNYHLD